MLSRPAPKPHMPLALPSQDAKKKARQRENEEEERELFDDLQKCPSPRPYTLSDPSL